MATLGSVKFASYVFGQFGYYLAIFGSLILVLVA